MATLPSPNALTTRVRDYRPMIEQIVADVWPTLPHGADWIEIAVLIGSGGNPRAVSRSGGQGLLQLNERVAVELGLKHPFSPEQNLVAGVTYLHSCFDKLEDVPADNHRLLWTFAANAGGHRGLGFALIALKLARADIRTDEWYRWLPGKFWLMHRNCSVSYRIPDYQFIWSYVDKIVNSWARRGA
jgi:membrane-bound lytic murein transglycosylase MltF